MRRVEALALLGICAGAAYLLVIWMEQARPVTGGIGYDLYQYYVPNMLYFVASVRDQLGGLLWNPYQSCGKAWLAVSSTGVLYPLNVLYLVFDTDVALLVFTALHLVIAGAGAFLLCRQLGAGAVGGLCAALAFELGNVSAWVTTWTPIIGAAYAWTPWVLLCCERVLQRPSARNVIGLGVAGTLAFLPGHPQVLFHVYQLVALRVAWELLVRGMQRPLVTLTSMAAGLVLPAFLGAIQLVPAIELVSLSIRYGALTPAQMGAGLGWTKLSRAIAWRMEVHNPVQLVPVLLAAASPTRAATRSHALFYLVAAGLSLILAFGYSTPVFDLYLALPLSGIFRKPERFLWVTGLCLAVLAGLGADALVARARSAARSRVPGFVLLAVVCGLFGAYAAIVGRPRPLEWAAVVAIVAAVSARGRRAAPWVAGVLIAVLCLDLGFDHPSVPGFFGRGFLYSGLMKQGDALIGGASTLRALGDRLTPQERVVLVIGAMATRFSRKAARCSASPHSATSKRSRRG